MKPPAARWCHWPLPPSASSRQPLRQWSSLPKAPWDCNSSYSWSRKSRLLLLGNPRMVNLWDTLVHCSRFAATLSYSSVAPGNSSESSLKGQTGVNTVVCNLKNLWSEASIWICYITGTLLMQPENQPKFIHLKMLKKKWQWSFNDVFFWLLSFCCLACLTFGPLKEVQQDANTTLTCQLTKLYMANILENLYPFTYGTDTGKC